MALLRYGLYVEPSVSFALTGPSSVTLGMNLPYTFDLTSLLEALSFKDDQADGTGGSTGS